MEELERIIESSGEEYGVPVAVHSLERIGGNLYWLKVTVGDTTYVCEGSPEELIEAVEELAEEASSIKIACPFCGRKHARWKLEDGTTCECGAEVYREVVRSPGTNLSPTFERIWEEGCRELGVEKPENWELTFPDEFFENVKYAGRASLFRIWFVKKPWRISPEYEKKRAGGILVLERCRDLVGYTARGIYKGFEVGVEFFEFGRGEFDVSVSLGRICESCERSAECSDVIDDALAELAEELGVQWLTFEDGEVVAELCAEGEVGGGVITGDFRKLDEVIEKREEILRRVDETLNEICPSRAAR